MTEEGDEGYSLMLLGPRRELGEMNSAVGRGIGAGAGGEVEIDGLMN